MTDVSNEAVQKAADRLKRKSGLFNSYTLEAEMLRELRQKLTQEEHRASKICEENKALRDLYANQDDLLSSSQAADALGIKQAQIDYALRMGWIPAPIIRVGVGDGRGIGRLWLRRDIEAFVAEKAKRAA